MNKVKQLLQESTNLLEDMQAYRNYPGFQKSPMGVVGTHYKMSGVWKDLDKADNHSIFPKLSPTGLKQGEDCIATIKETSATGIVLRVEWDNINDVRIGTTVSYESKADAIKEGWKV